MLSVGIYDDRSVRISGPDIFLEARRAELLGLAFHELMTNSVKYGALKVDGATLDIEWELARGEDGVRELRLSWVEGGVPVIDLGGARTGFGRELIEEALPYRLGARTKLEFRAGGVRCSICLPGHEDERDLLKP